jgi:hypothetical protein
VIGRTGECPALEGQAGEPNRRLSGQGRRRSGVDVRGGQAAQALTSHSGMPSVPALSLIMPSARVQRFSRSSADEARAVSLPGVATSEK